MLALIGPILSILASLLPEIIQLAKSWKETPQEERIRKLNQVREAMRDAKSAPGNTKPIEDVINK